MQDPAIEDKVVDALRELAGVVGQTAETLWPMAVEATWAKSISTLAVCGFVALLMATAILVSQKVAKRFPANSEQRFVITVIPLVICLVLCAPLLFEINGALPGLIAPEGITLFNLLK